MTGHADGSVRFWDASSNCMQALCRVRTQKLFEKVTIFLSLSFPVYLSLSVFSIVKSLSLSFLLPLPVYLSHHFSLFLSLLCSLCISLCEVLGREQQLYAGHRNYLKSSLALSFSQTVSLTKKWFKNYFY